MPKSSKQKQTSRQTRQSQLAEIDSWFKREINAGKYVPARLPDWQPPKENKEKETQSTKDITPIDKKELTPEEKYGKVRDAFLRIGKKLLEIDYPQLMKKKD